MKRVLTFLYKSVRFVVRYLVRDPLFVIYYSFAYARNGYVVNAKFYNDEQITNEIKQGKSIVRIGDGEIGLLHKRSISYQRADKDLIYFLQKSIKEYTIESPYVIAIPIFLNWTNEVLKEKKVFSCWLPLKVEFLRSFNRKAIYADAHFFYYKNKFEKNLEDYLRTKKIIVNTTKENIDLQKKTIEASFEVLGWVEAKSPEPFEWYEKTKKEIDALIETYPGNDKDIVLILSSGPLSKVLAYEYSLRGVQALDIGKGFEHIYNSNNFEHLI